MGMLGYYEKPWYYKWKWIVGIAFLIAVLLVFVWFWFFRYGECETWECFNENLRRCDRVSFVGGTDMIFEYTIRGSSGGECEVGVELLMGELNNQDSIKLERQKMTCMLPEKVVMIPESNIGRCHGLLKEGLQDLVIKKLHTYLVQNLGKINLELLEAPGG
jgi:hypothetical protein